MNNYASVRQTNTSQLTHCKFFRAQKNSTGNGMQILNWFNACDRSFLFFRIICCQAANIKTQPESRELGSFHGRSTSPIDGSLWPQQPFRKTDLFCGFISKIVKDRRTNSHQYSTLLITVFFQTTLLSDIFWTRIRKFNNYFLNRSK